MNRKLKLAAVSTVMAATVLAAYSSPKRICTDAERMAHATIRAFAWTDRTVSAPVSNGVVPNCLRFRQCWRAQPRPSTIRLELVARSHWRRTSIATSARAEHIHPAGARTLLGKRDRER